MLARNFMVYALVSVATVAALACADEPTTPGGPDAAPVPEFAVTSNSWITRRDMPSTERTSVTTATITNSSGISVLYVMGGRTASGARLGKVMAYHVATNSWTYHPDMPLPFYNSNGAGVINRKIYISGGQLSPNTRLSYLWMYDPASDTWTRKRDMPTPTAAGVSGVFGNRLYVLTYCDPEVCDISNDVPQFFRYDPSTDSWATLPSPNNAHADGVGGFMGGKFYVTGGQGGVGDSRKLDVYDPSTNTWATRASIPRKRWLAAGTAMGGKLYMAGGLQLNSDGTASSAVRTTSVYDPATNTWTNKAQMPSARVDVAASVVWLNGDFRLEVVGGARPGNNLAYIP